MTPIILLTKHPENIESFVDDFIRKHSIPTHNIYRIRPAKTELTIDQVRDIKREIITVPSGLRLFVLYNAENANIEAQNALLKTLEEKTSDNQFILCTDNLERLLPTIRSRSTAIPLDGAEARTLGLRNESESFIRRFESTAGMQFLGDDYIVGITREDALVLVDEIIVHYHDTFKRTKAPLIPLIKRALQTKELLQNNNLNPQLAVDGLLINLKANLLKNP